MNFFFKLKKNFSTNIGPNWILVFICRTCHFGILSWCNFSSHAWINWSLGSRVRSVYLYLHKLYIKLHSLLLLWVSRACQIYYMTKYVFTKYLERSKMISIYVTGCSIGTCILFPIAGLLISHWGWPSVFYMTGLVGIIWCAFWYWLAYDRWVRIVHTTINDLEFFSFCL